jgi:hypothetical protein
MTDGALPDWLFRFGVEVETAEDLENQCEAAVVRGFPHGVSVVIQSIRPDASMAAGAEVELYFNVLKTGRSLFHYTVVLPHPVTTDDAENFNRLFGRT